MTRIPAPPAPFDRILVGWNESASATAAASWAASRPGSAPITLVGVLGGHETGTDYLSARSPEAEARVRLMEAADELRRAHPEASISTQELRGAVVDELLALSTPRSLVVVGGTSATQKPSPFGWSVGSRLAAAHTPGAVAVVPADTTATPRRRLVVGYDGTTVSEHVLDVAIAEALSSQQELLVVHAWTEPPAWQDVYVPELGLEDSLEDVHQGVLDTAIRRAGLVTGLAAHGSLVVGTPADALIDAARTASEVVVGNHSDHGARRFFLGSVSHAVIRALVAPTLIVRS